MIHALTAAQMRSAEERAVADKLATLVELMDRAGAALAQACAERAPTGAVAVLAGGGNNGGDGWVAARVLRGAGREVHVFSTVPVEKLREPAMGAARAAIEAGVPWSAHTAGGPPLTDLLRFSVVVDALLGIGISGPVRPGLALWIEACRAAHAFVISADVPSGVDADTGLVHGLAVAADATVTFSAPKVGIVQYPGAGFAGEIVVADVGIPPDLLWAEDAPEIWSAEEYRELLPLPAPDDHKNARGRVLVVAGSGAYPGAAVLAAQGAQRMGAGYVTVAVPAAAEAAVRAHLVSAVVVAMPEHPSRAFAAKDAERLLELARDHDAVVLGPGITVSRGTAALARTLVARSDLPLVLDADALNALEGSTPMLAERHAPTVLTPHPGEAARLLGLSGADVQANRLGSVQRLAAGKAACVLKGAGTITAGDGRLVVNTSGSAALARAGTGDILSGMVGTLLAQGLSPLEAGALGAYLHGRAGDAAAEALTPVCVLAEDVWERLPEAVAELLGEW